MIFSVSLHFLGGVRFALLAMSLKKLTGDSSRWKRGMRSGVIGSLRGVKDAGGGAAGGGHAGEGLAGG